MIGTTVGNHRIVEKLGDGGMGTVYRAVDQMLDRDVAIKVLRPELTSQPALNDRFRAEAIAMARVSHPNITMLHGLERHGDDLYMVMEYVRGETLEHVVQRTGKLAWRRAAEILTSVLDALDHAHDMGVVHRDIKPANIMLTRTGAVKVMDFGIARMVGRSRQTQFGHAVGTPMYMAPEQLRGEDVDGRTDLYAVGASLFELVTGRMAFEADSDYKLMMMQLNDPPPLPSSIQNDVPASIDRIVLRAMEKKAENRFASAPAFRAALQGALGETVRPVPMPGRAENAPTPATRFAEQAAPTPMPAPVRAGAAAEASPPATRLPATDEHPRPRARTRVMQGGGGASRLDRLSPSTRERLNDWRTWAIAASLLVTAGMLALAFKPRGGVADQRVTDAPSVAPNAPSTLTAANVTPAPDSAPAGAVVALSTDSQRAVSEPPTRVAPPNVTPIDPVAPRRPTPQADRATNRGGAGGPGVAQQRRNAVDTAATKTPIPPADPPKEVRVADPPPAQPEESSAAAREAIEAALYAFAGAASSGSAGAVESVLRGPDAARSRFLGLVREGRLTVRAQPNGEPEIRGGEASMSFEARMSWRTPFGSVRRAMMPMQAEFSRNGRMWNLSSVRIVRAVDLK